jgi:hypothetical protein
MTSHLKLLFLAIGLLTFFLSCDMGVEVDDPFANEGIFELTVKHYLHETRVVAGRELIRIYSIDTTFTGNEATLRHSDGTMDITLQSNDVLLEFVGGVTGTVLQGVYDIINYDENLVVQQDKFFGKTDWIFDAGDNANGVSRISYSSKNGRFQIFMYRPGKRLRANFDFSARVNLSDEQFELVGFQTPDSVKVIGAFNAILKK